MAIEFNRREFLGTMAAAVSGATATDAHGDTSKDLGSSKGEILAADSRHMPDTVDLAERAHIAVNALTRIIDPAHSYEPYHQAIYYARPAYMTHQEGFDEGAWAGNELWGKHVEALRMMRIMSGSVQNRDIDEKTIQGMVSCFGKDGLYWKKVFRVQGDQAVPG